MNHILLLSLLITTSLPQIINKLPIKLSDLAKNSPPDALQTRATNYLLKVHPEFTDYNVTILNTAINRTNQNYADNLKDYLFQLNSTNNRIRALVTLSDLTKQRYVTISPVTSAPPHPPKGKNAPLNEYSVFKSPNRSVIALSSPIMNQSISSNNKSNSPMDSNLTKKISVSSYLLFQNQQDPLVQFAMDYIASQRPNIINYNVTNNIYYQLVAGLNIKIQYVGYDNFSRVTAVVNFDLKLKPTLLSFKVMCLYEDKRCREEQVQRIYESIQTILMFHPQLFAFRLINVKILQSMRGDSPKMRVMLTFENSAQKLRSLLEEQIVMNKVNLLSFYTYSYEQ